MDEISKIDKKSIVKSEARSVNLNNFIETSVYGIILLSFQNRFWKVDQAIYRNIKFKIDLFSVNKIFSIFYLKDRKLYQ